MAFLGCAPVRPVSESTRERETFKYNSLLLTDYPYNCDGCVPPSSDLFTAPDSVLNALAQLGARQTGTERAFVSLFDSTRQYVVAEATPAARIASGLRNDGSEVSLSLCGTAIPRDQGTCDHVLYLPPSPSSGNLAELPLSLVPDLTADDRFTSRPYCQFGEGGQFYAGVPIRTRNGINIGAYCVMSSSAPETWDDRCTQSLRDLSVAMMEHFELKRAMHESRKHERMNRGLGSFVEGKGTLSGWQGGAHNQAFKNKVHLEGDLDARQQGLEAGDSERKDGDLDEDLEPISSTRKPAHRELPERPLAGSHHPRAASSTQNREEDGTHSVFSRAANIIREAFQVEGCVFLDVTMGSFRPQTPLSPDPATHVDGAIGDTSTTSSSDEQNENDLRGEPGVLCDLLGFSSTEGSSINNDEPGIQSVGVVPKRFLAKLLRKYPNGRIFNFDGSGELQSSDFSEDDNVLKKRPAAVDPNPASASSDGSALKSPQSLRSGHMPSRRREGEIIRQAFPSARSVAFIPVWDSKRQRWISGGFIYTLIPTREFSLQGELSFLVAFGKLVAAEVLSLERMQTDRAKSDALGSLSHELRSPLHGVILSTELLNDTELSVFQGNATHTIETCCRTLVDTIEHLLDYSKVNSFAAKAEQVSLSLGPIQRESAKSSLFKKQILYRHVRVDRLVEEVVESVYAGFDFQRLPAQGSPPGDASKKPPGTARQGLKWDLAIKPLDAGFSERNGTRDQPGKVSVYVSIDPDCNWMFHAQPGALRRIVMNLLGNSLKYTFRGTIRVSLNQETARRSPFGRIVKLVVQDTGKGISEDYLQHRLFQPFAQEDELASGTGLGLSLVKKITSQLRGNISVKSQVGVGTTVTVTLPLEQSPQLPPDMLELPEEDRDFESQARELRGLRVAVSGFDPQRWGKDGRALVEDICTRWFRLELVSGQDRLPDIIVRTEDDLPSSQANVAQLARTPHVVVCEDARSACRLFTAYENLHQGRISECMSQPISPRALARSMLLAYKRWTGLPKIAISRPPGPHRSRSLHPELLFKSPEADGGLTPKGSHDSIDKTTKRRSLEIIVGTNWKPPVAPVVVDNPTKQDEQLPAEPDEPAEYLLVDDNPINLKVLSAIMGKLGQPYQIATNGKVAVDTYMDRPGKFVGVLMDISMPIMDGLEATREIRRYEHKEHLRRVPVLALTGLASESTRQEAAESGVDVFLTKPVRLKALGDALRSVGLPSS